jgi:outer membrane protein assembly factor BamB
MSGLERVEHNRIIISGKEIVFEYPIGSVEIRKDRIFLNLEIFDMVIINGETSWIVYPIKNIVINGISKIFRNNQKKNELNRVYCYDDNGNLIWQIKSPKFNEFPNFEESAVVGISYDRKQDKFFTTDLFGRCFDVNLETGEIMSFRTTK